MIKQVVADAQSIAHAVAHFVGVVACVSFDYLPNVPTDCHLLPVRRTIVLIQVDRHCLVSHAPGWRVVCPHYTAPRARCQALVLASLTRTGARAS